MKKSNIYNVKKWTNMSFFNTSIMVEWNSPPLHSFNLILYIKNKYINCRRFSDGFDSHFLSTYLYVNFQILMADIHKWSWSVCHVFFLLFLYGFPWKFYLKKSSKFYLKNPWKFPSKFPQNFAWKILENLPQKFLKILPEKSLKILPRKSLKIPLKISWKFRLKNPQNFDTPKIQNSSKNSSS